jgi:perosamine synthetase
MRLDPSVVIRAIRDVIGEHSELVKLHEPEFRGNEWHYVKDCLDTAFVSSVGAYVDRFECMLAEYTGAAKAVAVSNGTAALQICLEVAGVRAGDEVLIPVLSFVATANAAAHVGATPHFVDSDEDTLGLSPSKLRAHLEKIAEVRAGVCFNRETGARISAVVPMHTFGHPVELDALLEVADEFHLMVIEDAAESLGSFYRGRHTGTMGKLAALSFNGNKIVTTGGGGAILTNDLELAKLAKHLTTTAKVPHQWEFFHDMTAYNYRLPNLNAALGCAQMEELGRFVDQKRQLAARYAEAFRAVPGVRFFVEQPHVASNYWLNTLIVDEDNLALRDEVLTATNQQGIMTRPVWNLLHRLPMYASCPRADLTCAESLSRRIVNIPSSPHLAVVAGALASTVPFALA